MTIQPTRGDVFAEERQQHIARIVEEHGRARVAELSRLFGVSGVTIRKDLDLLEQRGRLVRTHGGAVVAGRTGAERAFDIRERLQRPEKDAIGRAAAAMVVDGESIALDASTTALAMARHLDGARRVAPPDRHHERPADRRRARRPSRDLRRHARGRSSAGRR